MAQKGPVVPTAAAGGGPRGARVRGAVWEGRSPQAPGLETRPRQEAAGGRTQARDGAFSGARWEALGAGLMHTPALLRSVSTSRVVTVFGNATM